MAHVHAATCRTGTRGWRKRARDFVAAASSTAVVAFLVAYAVTTPTLTLETTIDGTEAHPGRQAVVHGRVLEANGDGIADAEIRVRRAGASATTARSSRRGFFRIEVLGSCAASQVELVVNAEGKPVRTTLDRRLCPGEALEIDARIVASGQLIWIPTR